MIEHVARALEESANTIDGQPSKFPVLPAILGPAIRAIFFNRIVRKGVFPNAKASAPFDPATGSATPAEARKRMEAAVARFDQACQARAVTGPDFTSTIFGRVSLRDDAKFQEPHPRHHRARLEVHGDRLYGGHYRTP